MLQDSNIRKPIFDDCGENIRVDLTGRLIWGESTYYGTKHQIMDIYVDVRYRLYIGLVRMPTIMVMASLYLLNKISLFNQHHLTGSDHIVRPQTVEIHPA